MPRPPNYGQERAERNRAKERKRAERLERREADARKRKAEREGLIAPDAAETPSDTPKESA